MPLELESRQVGDITVVRCRGRIVAGPESQSLQDHVRELIPDTRGVVLDLTDVPFVDSSGLGMLVRLHASARTTNDGLRLCALTPTLKHVLQITNLYKLFVTHESEAEAISSFYQASRASAPGAEPSRVRILCVDKSADLLAYIRELARSAGYQPLTSSNLPDALLLIKAARPDLVVLGVQSATGKTEAMAQTFGALSIPVVTVAADFCNQDAGAAGSALLEAIRQRLASPSA